MTGVYRSARAFSLFRNVLVAAALLSAADVLAQEAAEPPLPLKRVVLFSSGVGFYEHRGEMEGSQQVTFSLKTADINDLLKSLVVQDFGGGLVTAVNYASPEPIARTLQGFTVDLHGSPSLAQIFEQLRGHKVKVETPAMVEGVVVGVESRTIPVQGASVTVRMLNLLTEQGLESVRIDGILRTQFLNAHVNREFQQALALLASSRQSEQKAIKLRFDGQGKRGVAAGYIQESPVWKTSYRLVLADEEAPQVQGWAIVENTTGQPWREVQLTLVSGRPISFLMDLYEPLYMPRPLVAPERHASLRPRVYEQDLSERAKAAAIEMDALAAPGGGAATRGGQFGMAGGMGGMMGGMGGGVGGRRGRAPSRPFVTTVVPATEGYGLDLNQGVAAAASGEELGDLFRYVITSAVSLDRNESAMLPIVNDTVKGEKLAIYNAGVHAKHPLSGLRLTNTTDVHWMQGPITVFDGGEYAGDARIEDIPPGATRLVSYALDLQTEVAVESQEQDVQLVGLRIEKGGLQLKKRGVRETQYVVKNSAGWKKQVVIERAIDGDWQPVAPESAEKTRSLHRFELEVQPHATQRLKIVEEKELGEDFALAKLEPSQIEVFLHMDIATPQLKRALEEAIRRKTALADAAGKRAAVERQMTDIGAEQSRLRSNVQSVSVLRGDDPFATPNVRAGHELLQRYLTKLGEQETELERLRGRLTELKEVEAKLTAELEAYLKELTVNEM